MSGWWARSEGGGERGGRVSRLSYDNIDGHECGERRRTRRRRMAPSGEALRRRQRCGRKRHVGECWGGVLASRSGVAQTAGIARES